MIFPKYLSDWHSKPNQILFKALYVLFLFLVSATTVIIFKAEDWTINWTISTESETIPVEIDRINTFFGLDIPFLSEAYIISQHHKAGEIQYDPLWTYLFASFNWILLLLILTCATFMKRNWFLGISTLFVFVLLSLDLDNLVLFGYINKLGFGLTLFGFLGLGYFFHAFRSDSSFLLRFLTFLFLSLGFTLSFESFATVQAPLLQLGTRTYIFTFFLSTILIFAISQEIFHAIFILTTSSKGRNNLTHFITFGIIYLTNLGLLYYKSDWVIAPLSVVILLSALLSLHLWYKRETRFPSLRFHPYGALILICLTLMFISLRGYLELTMNDPAVESLDKIALWSHMAFGATFLVYIVLNFGIPMSRGLQVHKVLFKDNSFPYLTANLGGLVLFGFLLFYFNKDPYYQTLSGLYNGMADSYLSLDKKVLAQQLYQEGEIYGYRNHKSNYQLGHIEEAKDNLPRALTYFEDANKRNPSTASLLRELQIIRQEKGFFESIFRSNELEIDLDNSKITNQLGMIYAESNLQDSADFYLSMNNDIVSVSNRLYSFVKHGARPNLNEFKEIIDFKDFVLQTNLTASQLVFGDKFRSNSKYQPENTTYFPAVNNYLLYCIKFGEIPKFSFEPSENERVEYLRALKLYDEGKVTESIRIFRRLAYYGQNDDLYFYTIGIIALEQRAYPMAAKNLKKAIEAGIPAIPSYIIACLESNESIDLALVDSSFTELLSLREKSIADIFTLENENLKSQIIWSKYKNVDPDQYRNLISTIDDQNLTTVLMTKYNDWQFVNGKIDKLDFEEKSYIILAKMLEVGLDSSSADSVEINEFFEDAKKNLLNQKNVIQAVNHLNSDSQFELAYDLIVKSLEIYPNCILYKKAKVLESLLLRLESQAYQGLQDLSIELDTEDFERFRGYYHQAKLNLGYYNEDW